MDNHLVLFAKQPRLGRVKSRLAQDIGVVAAWEFYRHLVAEIPRRLRDPRWRCWLAVTPDAAVSVHPWPAGWKVIPQGPGNLGDRMLRPLRTLPPGPVVIVGTDVPGIEKRFIEETFKKLGSKDAVFGPAEDGGFWLVGVRRSPAVPRQLYETVRWSHPETLKDTLANLAGMSVAFVETLADVDDGASYAALVRPQSPTAIPSRRGSAPP